MRRVGISGFLGHFAELVESRLVEGILGLFGDGAEASVEALVVHFVGTFAVLIPVRVT